MHQDADLKPRDGLLKERQAGLKQPTALLKQLHGLLMHLQRKTTICREKEPFAGVGLPQRREDAKHFYH